MSVPHSELLTIVCVSRFLFAVSCVAYVVLLMLICYFIANISSVASGLYILQLVIFGL